MKLKTGGVLAALSTIVVTPAAASPQGPWQLPAVDLSASSESAISPQIAIAADGTATAIWERYGIIQSASTARPSPPLSLTRSGTGAGNISYTKLTLTAAPDPGSSFEGWGGACTGQSGNTCALTMLADQSVTATFDSPPPPPPASKAKQGKKYKLGFTMSVKETKTVRAAVEVKVR